jgi:hypothetical protein
MSDECASGGDAPATLPINRPQPEPISTQAIQKKHSDGWWTTISRVFKNGEGRACRLCPAKMCGLDAHGHCMVSVPCYVPDKLAPTFPLLGDTGLSGPPTANRVADHG